MLEGILIEDQTQIAEIAGLCEFVYVDRTVSVGEYTVLAAKNNIVPKLERMTRSVVISNQSANIAANKNNGMTKLGTSGGQFSFLDVLKEIQASNGQAKNINAGTDDRPPVSINATTQNANTNFITSPQPENTDENLTLGTQIKTDFTKFIAGFIGWSGKSNKLSAKIDKNTLKQDIEKQKIEAELHKNMLQENNPVEYEIAEIYPVYEQSQLATREIFESLAINKEIDLSNINIVLDSMVDSIERNPDALIWLAKLKQSDNIAYNHALNVSITLMAFASFLSLPKKQVKELGLAGLLQDVGKSKIPHEILHKIAKITDQEFDILKKHVGYAMELLEVTANISATVMLTVSQHHERLDGSGYPHKLSGNKISLNGQMAGLIDSYCALTTNKVYAKGLYNQMALEEIQTLRDTQFNAALVDQLVQFLGMYPVSSLVELNSGEVAVVIQQNSVRRLLPRVMILLNADKTKNEYPATINLINEPLNPLGEAYKIVRGLPSDSYDLSADNYYG